jgi:hypothetical protein
VNSLYTLDAEKISVVEKGNILNKLNFCQEWGITFVIGGFIIQLVRISN